MLLRAARPVARATWVVLGGLLALGGIVGLARLHAAPPISFTNFETEPVRPILLSADGAHVFALNTADDRLEVLRATGESLELEGEVAVGLRPVALAEAGNGTVWVTNHLSDSVSLVDVSDPTAPRLIRTLAVGDEPRDIVVAGPQRNHVFVATAARGDPEQAGAARGAVWVFDANAPDGAPQVVPLFGTKARALAASADGRWVYAAIFKSGNRTTTVNERAVAEGPQPITPTATLPAGRVTSSPPPTPGPPPSPPLHTVLRLGDKRAVSLVEHPAGRGDRDQATSTVPPIRDTPTLPVRDTPTATPTGFQPPPISRIVRQQGAKWLDAEGGDWSKRVPFDLPDKDVFILDASAPVSAVVGSVSGVGTLLFNMAEQPGTGEVWVTNTEAHNMDAHEPTLRGRAVDNRVTRLEPRPDGGFDPVAVDLNPQIDRGEAVGSPEEVALSLAEPGAIAFSPDGSAGYVAAFGSRKVAVLDGEGAVVDRIEVGFGPGGIAVDGPRNHLYVLNRLDASITTVDLSTKATTTTPLVYDPTPAEVRAGRPPLYDAAYSSAYGDQACASCHAFGDMDGLAWDLGVPNGAVVRMPFDLTHENFELKPRDFNFHPLKGPMLTQSLRGLAGVAPYHWRGDRYSHTGAPDDPLGSFMQFQPAFVDLLGRGEPVPDADMEAYARFVFTIRYPPNPYESLDRGLIGAQRGGHDFFTGDFKSDSGVTNCEGCHALPLGTNRRINFEGDRSGQDFKAPHLRNLYDRVGRFDVAGDQVSGYGFTHDGSTDTVLTLLQTELFVFPGDARGAPDLNQRREVEAFLMAFDTGMAPAVGQQLTVAGALTKEAGDRLSLLETRAAAGDCDLIARQRAPQGEVAWLLEDGAYRPDRLSAPPLSRTALLALATGEASAVTFTCVPPGDGWRSALDRDGDGALNGDEREAGTNPADPGSAPGRPTPSPTATSTATPTPPERLFRVHLPIAHTLHDNGH